MGLRKLWLGVPCAVFMNLLFFCGVRGETLAGGMSGMRPSYCPAANAADLVPGLKASAYSAGIPAAPVERAVLFDPALVRRMAAMG